MTLHICAGPDHTATKIASERRWCFHCRRRTSYRYRLYEGPFSWDEGHGMWLTYYDPVWRPACDECGHEADLFPGSEYVYEE